MLSIRAWKDFAISIDHLGRTDLKDKYNGYASAKIAELQTKSLWLSEFGLHAAADAINTGLLNQQEKNSLFEKLFLDLANRISIPPPSSAGRHRGSYYQLWLMDVSQCRSASRGGRPASDRQECLGFRVVLAPCQP